jgi:type IV pilus secretin PilQ/predicted competence protein
MNTKNRLFSILFISGLLIVSASPFWAATRGQQADTSGQSPVQKPVHDRPIERFSVNNANVRAVFKQLSEYSGYDIVLADKVAGTVSISVTNKTWREIMGIICKITNLTVIKEPSYLYVIPAEDYRKQQLSDATMTQAAEAVEDLKRDVIRLSNVNAQEMSKSILPLLSSRGKITVVERNNALIIFDTEQNIAQIRKTIKELDVETDQVSISCKIIQVGSGVLHNLGIRWGYFDRAAGTEIGAQHLPGGQVDNIVAGALEKLTYGILAQDKFAIALEYLFQNSKVEVVAQPQITTLDNKEARIFMGSQVPIKYLDEARNTVVRMVDAGTELTVTPHITGDKRVMLNLNPKKRSYELKGEVPVINEQSAQTNVVVSDGETVVIAGLTSNTESTSEEGIPFLKDIPFLGNLFKRTKKSVDKSDLIVFVTPHIISRKIDAVSGLSETPGVK